MSIANIPMVFVFGKRVFGVETSLERVKIGQDRDD